MGSYDELVGDPIRQNWMIGIWLVFIIIAFLVYKDAKERGMDGLLWLVLVILPWIGIIFLIIYLITRKEKHIQVSALKDAQEILDERYAKGEITKEEYEQKKKDIKNQ